MIEDFRDVCTPFAPTAPDGWPVGLAPRWRSEVVVALARGIDADAAFDRLPVLADALEEAGCDRPEVLRHCRECPRHHPRCWVVNLALGRPPAPVRYDAARVAALQQAEAERLTAWAARTTSARKRSDGNPLFRAAVLLLIVGVGAVGGFRGLAGGTPKAPAESRPAGWRGATEQLDDSLSKYHQLMRNLDRPPNGGRGATAGGQAFPAP